MLRPIHIPELLSPAGGMESAIAAVNVGADAIYVGGKNFSARSSAQNFTDNELVELIEYAAMRGVRIYIAVNTLYKNTEIAHVVQFASQMHKEGAAAFILQDAGLAYILRSKIPEMEIHASTQMSVHSTEGVNFMQKMGFSRVVLARELSLEEIAEINANVAIETEVFVHGALCISYSGQCLMSSLIGGRSGNRGKCAQICRTRFDLFDGGKNVEKGYLLSPKDMMTLDILADIAGAGVTSLKIEGRMKSPEYVYLVTKAYRQKLDNLHTATPKKTKQELLQIFNRGGSFTTGYYNTYHSQSMMSTVTPKSTGVLAGEVVAYKNGKCKIKFTEPMRPGDGIEVWTTDGNHVGMGMNKQIVAGEICEFALSGVISKGCKVYKSYDKGLVDAAKKAMAVGKRVAVQGAVKAVVGEPFSLTITAGEHSSPLRNGAHSTVIGHPVEFAQNAPIASADILVQLSKTGGTPFEIEFTNVEIDDNIFISKSELNQLRRNALANLETEIVKNIKRPCILPVMAGGQCLPLQNRSNTLCTQFSVQLPDIAHLPTVVQHSSPRVYINYTAENIAALPSILGDTPSTEIYLALPQISRNATEAATVQTLQQLENTALAGYLVSTYGQLHMLQKMQSKKHIMLNHTFNIFNDWAVEYFTGMGIGVTLSQELSAREIKAMRATNFELIAYGRQTLMATHNAPGCTGKQCSKGSGAHTLRDKIGMHFPIETDCESCIAYVLNCKVLDTAPKFAALKSTGAASFRLMFTNENEKEISEVICRYKNLICPEAKSLDRKIRLSDLQDTTYGHFFRGVE